MATINLVNQCVFDFGALEQLPKLLARLDGSRPFVVSDSGLAGNGLLHRALDALGEAPAGIFTETPPNPTEGAARAAAAAFAECKADCIIALGGGSAMDLAKAVGLMARHDPPYERYGASQRGFKHIRAIPELIAIPTTAGTGSEVSSGFVLIMESGRKETFLSSHLTPKVALCDPDLTLSLPPGLTAATGMDAVTHCIEAMLSNLDNPPAEGIGLDGLYRAIGRGSLERAVADGSDRAARWDMMMAGYEGALAFSKGLGAVHGLSHALGRIEDLKLHHGTLNAIILPHALAMIGMACEEKFTRMRSAMGLPANADLVQFISDLNARIGLPAKLADIGVTEAHWPDTRDYAVSDFATATNAIEFGPAEYDTLFARAL